MLFVTFSLRGDWLRVRTDDAVGRRGGRLFEGRIVFDESVADLVVRSRGVLTASEILHLNYLFIDFVSYRQCQNMHLEI